MDLDNVGKLIKDLRMKKGLTQEELASKINVTNKAISRWECGKGLPDTSLLEPLSKELDISISELLNGHCTSNDDVVIKNNTGSKKNFIFLVLFSILILMVTIYYLCNYFYRFDNSYFIILKNNFSYLPFSNIYSLFITGNCLLFFKNIVINLIIGTFISMVLVRFDFNKKIYLVITNILFEVVKWLFFFAIFDIDDLIIRVICGALIFGVCNLKSNTFINKVSSK